MLKRFSSQYFLKYSLTNHIFAVKIAAKSVIHNVFIWE